jgi:signal transduction histidine kinase
VQLEEKTQPDGTRGVNIEIEDNGPGFAEEAVKKAGTPFWTRRTVGMGLGLAVARKVIQLHQGKLDIQPQKEGSGGVVAIWLPTSPDDTGEPSKPPNSAQAPQRKT